MSPVRQHCRSSLSKNNSFRHEKYNWSPKTAGLMLPVRGGEACPCLKLCKSEPGPRAKGGKKEVGEQEGLQQVAKKRTNLHPDKEAKALDEEDVGIMCVENGLSN